MIHPTPLRQTGMEARRLSGDHVTTSLLPD